MACPPHAVTHTTWRETGEFEETGEIGNDGNPVRNPIVVQVKTCEACEAEVPLDYDPALDGQ